MVSNAAENRVGPVQLLGVERQLVRDHSGFVTLQSQCCEIYDIPIVLKHEDRCAEDNH